MADMERRCRTYEARIKKLQELHRGIEEDGPDKRRVAQRVGHLQRHLNDGPGQGGAGKTSGSEGVVSLLGED